MPVERVPPLRVIPGGGDEPSGAPTLDAAFRQYAPYVARIALRLLGRDAEVDDVIQEVFLHAVKGLSALREPEAVRPWLATVAVRVARKKLRTRRLKSWLRLDDAPDYEQVAAPGASPEERALLARVYAILDEQPVEQRLAWTLRYVEREQLDEVAALCGCSLATAKRRISAAQAAIEEVIGE